ncbi:MAG: patatin-like phospholipase family protein [Prochlorotrichaceae cyanobacterium]|jgi:patatin-like phospholipase/acyl hydrolase
MLSPFNNRVSRRKFLRGVLATTAFASTLKLSAGCATLSTLLPQGNSTYRVLCCDGGGLKGLITAIILERLEAKIARDFPDRPLIKDHFNLFAGTSTGSIIACGLAKGITATEIRKFYVEHSQVIFPNFAALLNIKADQLLSTISEKANEIRDQLTHSGIRFFQGIAKRLSKFQISLPALEEESKNLEQILQEVFGLEESFSSLDKSVVVLAYDTSNRKPALLKNTNPQPQELDSRTIAIWEICRASSAVPGIFPGYFLEDPALIESIEKSGYGKVADYEGRSGIPLIDGGVVTNNPSLWAIQEAHELSQKPILLASFGTGQKRDSVSPQETKEWGLIDWFNPFNSLPLLDVMFSASADTVNATARQLLDDANLGQYLRYQPELDQDSVRNISTFVSSPENLKKMEEAARLYLEEQNGDRLLEELVQKLKS